MEKRQINQLNMGETVVQFFFDASNIALWNTNPAITAAVNAHKGFVDAINQLSPVQQTSTAGATATKNEAKDNMAELAFAAASAGKSYAHATNNTVLFNAMSVSVTDITSASDNTADDIAQNIHDALVVPAILPNLANYGADTTSLAALQTAITTFSGFLGIPQLQASVSTTATGTLAEHFTDMLDNLKNQLDSIMVQFKASNPRFYNNFISARVIHNVGVRKTVLIGGFVYNNHTPAQPLQHVLMTLTGTDSNGYPVTMSKHTDVNGHYSFVRLHIGTYTITPSLSGYTGTPKTFTVTENQVINNDFIMIPV